MHHPPNAFSTLPSAWQTEAAHAAAGSLEAQQSHQASSSRVGPHSMPDKEPCLEAGQWVTLCEKDVGQDLAQQAGLSRAASLQTLLGSLSCQVQLLLSTQEQRQQAPQQACRQLACPASVLATCLQQSDPHCPL